MKEYLRNIVLKSTAPLLLIAFVALGGCKPKPVAMDYGKEGCHFCSMTIVDGEHAAEIVTKKGKVYKFDAVECMLNFRKQNGPTDVALYLSNHYTTPVELIDATQASFLISENIPSPMGAFLTAFKSRDEALVQQAISGGEVFAW